MNIQVYGPDHNLNIRYKSNSPLGSWMCHIGLYLGTKFEACEWNSIGDIAIGLNTDKSPSSPGQSKIGMPYLMRRYKFPFVDAFKHRLHIKSNHTSVHTENHRYSMPLINWKCACQFLRRFWWHLQCWENTVVLSHLRWKIDLCDGSQSQLSSSWQR